MTLKKNFTNKSFCITGGTGSFGRFMLDRLLKTDAKSITIFSRDEKKQDDLRKIVDDERVSYVLGDVRDINDIRYAFSNVNYVFHAAALKQVPSCEFFPEQALRTNADGTRNAIKVARELGIEKFVLLSTDKAVYPINAMGITKALAEKIVQAEARKFPDAPTKLMITRYGNVMGSRGSVIPLFIDQILSGKKLTITNPDMTRFLMNLNESIDLVLYAFEKGKSGNIYIHKAPSTNLIELSNALKNIFSSNVEIDIIGTRHGEKLFETLVSDEEMVKAIDRGKYFEIPLDERNLNYSPFFDSGNKISQDKNIFQFNSHNAKRINGLDLERFLSAQDFIAEHLKKSE